MQHGRSGTALRATVGLLLLAGAAALVLPGAAAAAPGTMNVTVHMGDFWFSPNYIAVDVNTTLNITVVNHGSQPHEYEVLGYGVETGAAPGQNGTLEFLANRTGLFTVICGVSGHSTQGMTGRLIVLGPGFELNPLPEVASQIIGLLEAVEHEYEEANVSGGAVQHEAEYNESRDFAQTARGLWETIRVDATARDASGAGTIDHAFDELVAGIAAKANYSAVEHEVDELVHELQEIGGAAPGSPSLTLAEHLAALRSGLAAVVAQYKAGDAAGADVRLGNVYLDHLEPLEGPVAAVDPDLKTRMESQVIIDLRGLLRSGASPSAVDAKWGEINATLAQVEVKIAPAAASAPASTGPWLLLGVLLGLMGGMVFGVAAFGLLVRRARAAATSAPPAPAEASAAAAPHPEGERP